MALRRWCTAFRPICVVLVLCFFAFQSTVVICCARLLFLNCGLVWLAAVLDGGGRVLLRVLYMSCATRGALFDACCGPFCRAVGIRRSGSPGGRINSVFSFKVLACCTANARGFFFKTVVAGGHAVHAWRCFASYAIALKCALLWGVFCVTRFRGLCGWSRRQLLVETVCKLCVKLFSKILCVYYIWHTCFIFRTRSESCVCRACWG